MGMGGEGGGGDEMVTARLLTNCSNTLCNIHANAKENIARTCAKQKVGYFVMAHLVYIYICKICMCVCVYVHARACVGWY